MHHGIDRDHMDLTVRPQDDLFGHANGGWLADAQIPQDRARYGAFDMLREQAETAVRELIEEAARRRPELGTPEGKVGALYASFTDTAEVARVASRPDGR